VTASTPEGYLGTDGRISSGPAPELVAAGYALEMGDAQMLHEGLGLADLAHVIMLARQHMLPAPHVRPLLTALLELGDVPFEEFPYDVMLGDAYNSREKELTRRVGDLAGWVHLGRTRREAGRIAFRLAVRELILDLDRAVSEFASALADRADETAETLWADMTYLQPAQPSTFGHYLASFSEEASRGLLRLRQCYAWVDVSPAGSGGVAGTRLGLDRDGLAALLGFAAVGRNTRDTMWNVDGLIDVVSAAVQAALTADRLAEDLQIFTSPGFGFVTLDASMCRASVLMPQKRNPYALAVIRSGASTLIGRLTGLMATARTPSAQTDNWLHTYGEVASSLVLSRRIVELASVVVRTLTLDTEALARSAADEQIAATDLADELVLRSGLDYRTAYRIVGRAVAVSMTDGGGISRASLDAAAIIVTGSPLPAGDAPFDVAAVLDPEALVASRRESGGCAPHIVRAEIASLRPIIAENTAWCDERRKANRASRALLLDEARSVAADGPTGS
jgi:argininosuccinate lyase